ncbi:MAG: cbb3-type cytochrome c oxidase subunit 3 [Weeksellaceae bacterium]|jgi:cbb3-type cytochrome oxidase subunit 3|nr:cbb3-type cytochrome c oxidase subunit 3 [Weeksellaceae bacterium]
MIKYFKESFGNYDYAMILQVTSLALFVIFFSALIYFIWNKPKNHYEENARLPLEDGEEIN